MEEKLTNILEKYCGSMDFFAIDIDLADRLDSLLLIEMITEIEKQFEIEFGLDDLKQEIISSPRNLLELIEQKKECDT